VAQNIEDKRRFVSELARVIAPGGRVAMFELTAGPGGELEFLGQEVVASIAEAATSEPSPSPRHALDLGLLMPNYAARMASMGRNVAEARTRSSPLLPSLNSGACGPAVTKYVIGLPATV
jgi:hypothetical protein